ncbi:lipocalin family protein [Allomuricauda sp. SCSIO 65647]|uniref:lipocalin family protein n=1 Tax=Allomuricauda sp. SCSIO 65647 TaxID=2908843 RepID=UPI001F2662B2|nr:lipocalin family protein [Muricauda sp. SCSIO 65647]UJH68424.1 lipocalin family protein [Muricauda sp. SCSIO 65647]
MKRFFIPLFVACTFIIACSTDNEENNDEMETASLVGTWNLTDARFEENGSLNFVDEVVDFLAAQDCFLISFTFNADGTVTSEDKINYLQQNVGTGGLDIDCPTQSDTETATWVLEGDQLTLDDGNGTTETITIAFEGNSTLVIAGEDIDANNYAGAEAVFTKQ